MNKINTIIANYYQIIQVLGEGGSGIIYQAKDLKTSKNVAIKTISLKQMQDWKKLEFFEREARVLQQLKHPNIPQYIDYFIYDSNEDIYYQQDEDKTLNYCLEQGIEPDQFFIVQELITGENLASLIETGWRPNEAEVKNIAIQVLKILIYLQQLIPAVTHRDIKPQNLIRNQQGEIFLVDFGGVQEQLRQTTMASSVVGTYGYMSPEQLKGGKTYLSTDLYGLGATLIYLLTGKHPSELLQKRLKMDVHSLVDVSYNFRHWLDRLIEPNHQNRLPSAQVALELLEGDRKLKDFPLLQFNKPINSSISLVKTTDKLVFTIPSALSRQSFNYMLAFLMIGSYMILLLIWLSILSLIKLAIMKAIWFFYLFIFCDQIFFSINKKNKKLDKRQKYSRSFAVIYKTCALFMVFIIYITPSFDYSTSGMHRSFTLGLSIFILFTEFFLGELLQNLLREFCFDTRLEIYANQEIKIQQKSWFSLLEDQYINKKNSLKMIKHNFCRLLTKREQQWLIQEIKLFQQNCQLTKPLEVESEKKS